MKKFPGQFLSQWTKEVIRCMYIFLALLDPDFRVTAEHICWQDLE